jgi:hypothetical protein
MGCLARCRALRRDRRGGVWVYCRASGLTIRNVQLVQALESGSVYLNLTVLTRAKVLGRWSDWSILAGTMTCSDCLGASASSFLGFVRSTTAQVGAARTRGTCWVPWRGAIACSSRWWLNMRGTAAKGSCRPHLAGRWPCSISLAATHSALRLYSSPP